MGSPATLAVARQDRAERASVGAGRRRSVGPAMVLTAGYCLIGGRPRKKSGPSDHANPLGRRRAGEGGVAGGERRAFAEGEFQIEGVIGG